MAAGCFGHAGLDPVLMVVNQSMNQIHSKTADAGSVHRRKKTPPHREGMAE
jgi:hypothetical protein